MLVFKISRLYTQALQSNNFFFEGCQKCQNSVHTFPQDFSFFSLLPKLVELWLKKKRRKQLNLSTVGISKCVQNRGESEYGGFFFDRGLEDSMNQRKVPKKAIFDIFYLQNLSFTIQSILKIDIHVHRHPLCMCMQDYGNR